MHLLTRLRQNSMRHWLRLRLVLPALRLCWLSRKHLTQSLLRLFPIVPRLSHYHWHLMPPRLLSLPVSTRYLLSQMHYLRSLPPDLHS